MQGFQGNAHDGAARIAPLGDGVDGLIGFLTSDTWPYHGVPNPDPEAIRRAYEGGTYNGEGTQTFWILGDNGEKAGLVRIFDLQDPTPLFDIRIHGSHRGKGLGTQAVRWLVGHVFGTFPDKHRIEGCTRRDNEAMRKVFRRCGFVKEAHHRRAWGSMDGTWHDAIGYAILRSDWETGKATPVDWMG